MAVIHGELGYWGTKERLARILGDAGLRVVAGRYSVRVGDCSRFVFHFDGVEGECEPCIQADGDSVESLTRDAKPVSDALAKADIQHRFEIYGDDDEPAGYLHHRWPKA